MQQNGKEVLLRAAFGCQTCIVYGALGKGSNQLCSFVFFLLLARFAVKRGGIDFPRALCMVPLFMPVHSGHQVGVLVLVDKAVSAGPEVEMCC